MEISRCAPPAFSDNQHTVSSNWDLASALRRCSSRAIPRRMRLRTLLGNDRFASDRATCGESVQCRVLNSVVMFTQCLAASLFPMTIRLAAPAHLLVIRRTARMWFCVHLIDIARLALRRSVLMRQRSAAQTKNDKLRPALGSVDGRAVTTFEVYPLDNAVGALRVAA